MLHLFSLAGLYLGKYFFKLLGSDVRIGGGVGAGRQLLLAVTAKKAEAHGNAENDCKKSFHV